MTRWTLTALLLLSLGAAAQQASNSSQASNAQSVSAQPTSTSTPGAEVAQQAARTPVSADQVIDQMIEREHALITFLSTRKPIVETYLQNLVPDAKLGAVPQGRPLFSRPPRHGRNHRASRLSGVANQPSEVADGRCDQALPHSISADGIFVDDLCRPAEF